MEIELEMEIEDGRWTMDDGRWTMDDGQKIKDKR